MDKVTVNSLSIPKHINSKIEIVEATLHQTIYHFKDLVAEFEQMHIMTESVKKQVIQQKEKCESKCCIGSEELKKVIESKENIIQLVASALLKLNETKDFGILIEVFRILYGESLDNIVKEERKKETNSDINIEAMTLISPVGENMSLDEQDVSQIDGTPTGRSSPIIQSKKLKSFTSNIASGDKKKCPDNWTPPEKKDMKVILSYPTPTKSKGSGRLRQQRIAFVRAKPSTLVDLTTTPQFAKGRNSQEQDNIKRELIENDETIMPSPTSGQIYPPTFKSLSKESPQKFKRPLSLIRSKAEKFAGTECKENVPVSEDVIKASKLEESINLLKDYSNGLMSPRKCKSHHKSLINTNDSVSLLQPLQDLENKGVASQLNGPVKHLLMENVNAVNVLFDGESSMSILHKDLKIKTDTLGDNIKTTKAQKLEPLYKEPTTRKKAEKRALPGWSCEQCKNFYGELYKDDLDMQAKKMEECSKHRGRSNPVRPTTPPGYWQPRWDIPEDTEEFNRRNNAF